MFDSHVYRIKVESFRFGIVVYTLTQGAATVMDQPEVCAIRLRNCPQGANYAWLYLCGLIVTRSNFLFQLQLYL